MTARVHLAAIVAGALLVSGVGTSRLRGQQSWTPIGFEAYWPDTVRLLDQVTFGPTPDLVLHVDDVGTDRFLAEQFDAAMDPYPDLPPMPSTRPADCTGACQRENYTMYLLQRHFFTNALFGSDQLRQRVAFALGQILVVSAVNSNIRLASWMQPYQQLLYADAFGDFRQLLEDVTLNAAMGSYLNVLNNKKFNPTTGVKPNENFAREVLQLFSIGLVQLNQDGTPVRDAQGATIPTYDQPTIEEFARVFTGWILAPAFGSGIPNYRDPMVVRVSRGSEVDHDTDEKHLLGGAVVAAGLSARQDLEAALDNIFYHPNVAPFICKQLIQHLVTSNPSPAYVARIANVFDDDGEGVRGDLKAVVRAILVDEEARGDHGGDTTYGHLAEPALFIARVLRAFHPTSDGVVNSYAASMGQDVFRAPSVFNFYPPGYRVFGTNGLLGPEFKLHDSSSALARANFVNTVILGSIAANGTDRPLGTKVDLTPLVALAGQPETLVSELNGLLLHQAMPQPMIDTIISAVRVVPAGSTLLRVKTAAYLVMTSALYQVQQ